MMAENSADPNSKHQRSPESCLDRISQLPDHLIEHILSFLPTKDAVATSILSKRWYPFWTKLPVLHVEDSTRCETRRQTRVKFKQFVSRVLLLNEAASLHKFRLDCRPIYEPKCFNNWVCSAINKGVREIDISISTTPKYRFLRLPCRFFQAEKLRFLKLSGGVLIDIPGESSVSFPSLKTLHLLYVNIANDESLGKLFSGCFVLETLLLKTDYHENTLDIKLCSSTLKSLSINLRYAEYKLEINAPVLEYLELEESYHQVSFIGNLSSLVEANIHINYGISLNQLIRVLYNVKLLSLASYSYSEPLEILIGLPGWDVLSHLLTLSHNLQTLVVENNSTIDSRWTEPEHVPTCVSSRLTTASFKVFQGLRSEMQAVEYILKNAKVLKIMQICTLGMSQDSKSFVRNRLSEFQWGSKTCQVAIQ
ncbi:PREDICTED: putative FBD-associated F-box protein At3g50710 isoform X2 [Theobroma cacao]|uniref:FBD-associated F-box protein At3g50710 isoform X2 n=2 Tax=Theobroma cacao TaxID=3641 RepID=A0AB32UY86_THECC|nr:PREDICTED: putative FBD-associated F-box protein At3g50710 isoform X2 [Theobroma cacao]